MTNGREKQPHPMRLWEREWKKKARDPKGRHKGQVMPLDGTLGEWGSSPKVRTALNEAHLFNRWREIAGEKVADQAVPARLDRGKLTLQVADSTWRHQLLYMRRELIGKINATLGRGVVKEIIFTA
jgi:predicted nucleic acid-binding Zn ribbon protein